MINDHMSLYTDLLKVVNADLQYDDLTEDEFEDLYELEKAIRRVVMRISVSRTQHMLSDIVTKEKSTEY